MNSNDLHDLFDEAATSFSPQPDVARFTALMHGPRRGRPVAYGIGAVAAAVLFTVGGAAAMSGGSTADPQAPGGLVELPSTATAPPTTEHVSTTTAAPAKTPPEAPQSIVVDVESQADSAVAPTTVVVTLPPTTLAPTSLPPTTLPPETSPPTTKAAVAPASTTAPETTHAPPPPPPTTHAPTTTHVPPPPPTTHAPTTTAGGQVGFSAQQTWGSCGSVPPYEELNGTATPGSTINVSSPYGSGSTTADAGGHWNIQVFFSGAPVNQGFTITVSSAQGSATFPFVVTA